MKKKTRNETGRVSLDDAVEKMTVATRPRQCPDISNLITEFKEVRFRNLILVVRVSDNQVVDRRPVSIQRSAGRKGGRQ